MSGPNPLIAKPKETTTGVTGIGIAESAVDLANGISDGSWVEGGLGAIGVGLEVLSMAIDPVGTVLQYGVSWLIEHVEPLKEALDWFAGDPPVIQSFSDTWANVAAEVKAVAGDLQNEAAGGTAGWEGTAADAYRGQSAEQADAIAGAGALADGISGGVMVMGMVVAAVRELVRDLVAELVAKLITWALEAVATLGFGAPVIAAQATAAIAKVTNRISDLVRKLIKTIGNVTPRLRKVIDKLGEIMEKLSKIGRKLDGGTTPSGVHGPKVDAPSVKSPDAPTTPSSATTPSGTSSPDAPSTKSPDTTSPSSASPDGTPSSTSPNGSKSPDGKPGDTSPSSNRPKDPNETKTPPEKRTKCNDPVDVVSGEVIMEQVDVELSGILPLVLQRTHVSSYRAGRIFGRSWASTLDQRLELDEQGVVFVADDGTLLVYPDPPADDAVMPQVGPQWPLARTDTGFAVTNRDAGTTLRFSGDGPVCELDAIEDRNANVIEIVRDGGSITGVRHSAGHYVDVTTEERMVTELRLRNPAGADVSLVRFSYDSARNLAEVVNSSGAPLRFEYDELGRLTQWIDRNGNWYMYFYDADGRCIANQGIDGALNGTFTYDRENRSTLFRDALGNTTTFIFDERNNLVSEIDALGNENRTTWDERDRVESRTDPLGRVTRYEYDEAGNLVRLTRPDGSQVFAEYNELGLPLTVVDPDGAVWRRQYDERGNQIAVTDPSGATTRYVVDERGRLSEIVDALGNTRRLVTNAAGLPVSITDPLGATTRYQRDAFGRVIAITDPAMGTTRYTWTVEGKPTSKTRPGGATQRWRYDSEGCQVEHVDPLGRVFRTESTHFDLPALQVRPDGSQTTFSYDANLRVVAIADTRGKTWRFEYDAAGRVLREIDSNGRELRFAYDAAGQLVQRVNAAGESTQFRYNDAGDLVGRTSADVRAEFDYDAMGRMTRARSSDADVVFERDVLGRVLRETINGRSVTSAYDALGRRIRRVTPTGAESQWDYDQRSNHVALRAAGRTMSFGYDAVGREIERLVDTGCVIAQAWDSDHRLSSQTVSAATAGPRAQLLRQRRYQYFADGQVAGVSDEAGELRRYELDPVGRVLAVVGAGADERYSYDDVGNVTAATWSGDDPAQGPRELSGTQARQAGGIRYERDAQGRVTMRQKRRLSAKPATWRYYWNAEDRLTGVTTPDQSNWRYRYDALGRRVAKEKVGPDGSVQEWTNFSWDGLQLAEQVSSNDRATTWEWAPGTFRALAQTERERSTEASQEWVDREFYAIVTDLIGTPTELVDTDGAIAWNMQTTVWGKALSQLTARSYTPLRFPGQYHDAETGFHYNFQRYYDPDLGQYISSDPMGAAPGPNPYAYASNPLSGSDPLGLLTCEQRIDNYRGRYQVGKGKNIAVAEFEINGKAGELTGVSGKHQYPGSAPMPANPQFTPGFKDADSEWKMLEEIAKDLDPSASGRIHITSERPVCSECQGVVAQFRQAFPNIELTYSDLGRS